MIDVLPPPSSRRRVHVGVLLRLEAIALLVAGLLAGSTHLGLVGLVWVAHIELDRALGLGLKDRESFRRTHLQKI